MLALLKNAKLLEVIISGESLFNDGVAVTLFTILSATAFGQSGPTPVGGLGLILQEVGGASCFVCPNGQGNYRANRFAVAEPPPRLVYRQTAIVNPDFLRSYS